VAFVAIASALAATPGLAAQFSGTLEFIEPTGVVGPADDIPVWVRFTLDPASPDPLTIDGTVFDPSFGVPSEYLPTEAQQGRAFFEGKFIGNPFVFINTAFLCSGTFTTSCANGPPYDFEFNTSGPDSINQRDPFSLQPGESFDYLFGTFKPSGPVNAGTYWFYGSYVTLNASGRFETTELVPVLDDDGNPVLVLDDEGNPVPQLDDNGDPVLDDQGNPVFQAQFGPLVLEDAFGSYDIAATPCGGPSVPGDPACDGAFSRTVVPVPPAAWLLGSALGALVLGRQRAGRGTA
jgi:hypothetical protein